ncbi:septum site-determining protein MinC [Candidatus Poribacteria bacterium]|nr:septum site-determining protein MinC [Candidatus Poribacteria bacterium]
MSRRASSKAVEIKGYEDNINIIVSNDASFSEVEAELLNKLMGAKDFLKGVPVILDVGNRSLSPQQFVKLNQILNDRFNIMVSAIRTNSEQTRRLAVVNGWKVEHRRQQRKKIIEKLSSSKIRNRKVNPVKKNVIVEQDDKKLKPNSDDKNDTYLYRGTIRSGQRKAHVGNLLIIGDVNPGGEIIATGDIVVIGRLRGMAHAGAGGNSSAEIIALHLQPMQLRIADYIGRAPDQDPESGSYPEKASVENGSIVIQRIK